MSTLRSFNGSTLSAFRGSTLRARGSNLSQSLSDSFSAVDARFTITVTNPDTAAVVCQDTAINPRFLQKIGLVTSFFNNSYGVQDYSLLPVSETNFVAFTNSDTYNNRQWFFSGVLGEIEESAYFTGIGGSGAFGSGASVTTINQTGNLFTVTITLDPTLQFTNDPELVGWERPVGWALVYDDSPFEKLLFTLESGGNLIDLPPNESGYNFSSTLEIDFEVP